MADALYDIIVAGVPHRVLETDAADVLDCKLNWGQTVKLSHAAAGELEERYDFAVTAETGPAARLAVALSFRGLRVGVIDLGSSPVLLQGPGQGRAATVLQLRERHQLGSLANASRFHVRAHTRAPAIAIHYGAVDAWAARQSTLLARASKVLCLEDRLWDVEGGAEFAAAAIEVAVSAGRKVVLICKDPDCVLRNRVSIRNLTENRVDYIVGEATIVQLLYDLEPTDSLVKKLRAVSAGALLWRHSLAPLILEGNIIGPTAANEMIDANTFWSMFLPQRLSVLLQSGAILSAMEQHRFKSARFRDQSN
jgi:hypothetical protein